MTVSGTGNTSSLSSTQYTAKTTATGDQIDNPQAALGKYDFLQMLVTRLANQDPLDAKMDESFTADMAQFSSLEQMTSMNTGLGSTNVSLQDLNKNIISLMLLQNTAQAAALIGKTVTITYNVVDANGIPVKDVLGNQVTATLNGSVDAVKFVDGLPKINVGGKLYELSQVREISA